MTLEVGQVFAGYTISRVLGAGGMGAVYLASHPRLPREEALKVLPADLTTDPEFRWRFVREAELASALSHPHIVRIHDRGEADGQFWISMDHVAGTDAARLLDERYPSGMPLSEALPIIAAVGSALDYAHRRGLLHRDVKPANILLTDTDAQGRRVYLADFGVARRIDEAAGLTATNTTVGTVCYAAPEQLRGEALDGRADQYALACTAFHLLTGVPPYGDSNPAVVISRHVGAPVPSLRAYRPELAALDPVFATAMAKEPSARFGSCREFTDQLSQYLTDSPHAIEMPIPLASPEFEVAVTPAPPPVAKRRAVLVGALAGTALLIAGGVFAVVKLSQQQHPAAAARNDAPAKAGRANTGPFTGIYRVQFGQGALISGAPAPGALPTTETFAVRSVCRSSGCLATASRLDGDTTYASHPVFDEVDGRWIGVNLGTHACRDNNSAEVWDVFTLQPGPDGGFTGEYSVFSGNECGGKHSVTFTRTSDVDVDTLPDPAALPPRFVSSAEALRGRYHQRRTYKIQGVQQEIDFSVTTECLRTGDRCMSYFYASSGQVEPLLFGGGKWVLDTSVDGNCPRSGAPMHMTRTGQYPLPQPPQNPIPLLTGHGKHVQTLPCALTSEFDETFTRTGD
jgi:Protein kinase domain